MNWPANMTKLINKNKDIMSTKERIEKLISKYGSIELFAGNVGVSVMTVYRWRDGRSKPSRMADNKIKLLYYDFFTSKTEQKIDHA